MKMMWQKILKYQSLQKALNGIKNRDLPQESRLT